VSTAEDGALAGPKTPGPGSYHTTTTSPTVVRAASTSSGDGDGADEPAESAVIEATGGEDGPRPASPNNSKFGTSDRFWETCNLYLGPGSEQAAAENPGPGTYVLVPV
jgi:hypothetical protein